MRRRVRPHDPPWPSPAQWAALHGRGGGRLIRVHSPFSGCGRGAAHRACQYAIKYLRDEPRLTQRSGDAGARISRPSAYAVCARDAADVAAAVEFARHHRLLPVINSAGHRYQGTSDAPASLLIWTRDMDRITIEESFRPVGRTSEHPHTAVSIAAGAVWMDAYHAVTTVAGRYVQGGDCATVGVAGLVQSGGFGSFSKHFGTRAAALLQAEVATARGGIRRVNANRDADLFWPLKGVGGTFLRAGGPSAFAGLPGANADLTVAHREAPAITRSSGILRRTVPGGGSYVSESNYFQADWQHAFCSAHYPGLSAVKMKYDPASLFFLHHGVGSEYRSADGFSPKRRG